MTVKIEYFETYLHLRGIKRRARKPASHLFNLGNVPLTVKDSPSMMDEIKRMAIDKAYKEMKETNEAYLKFSYGYTDSESPEITHIHPFDERNFKVNL